MPTGSRLGTVDMVLTGRAVEFARQRPSAIAKAPRTGRVAVWRTGLDGDEQGDTRFHGGPDKAVHAYAAEHYPEWIDELGRLPVLAAPGAFGENLSTTGITEAGLCLGDRLRIGSTVFEISQARQPCWKLNERFGVPDMARRVQDKLRTGWYLRVLEPGSVAAGDDILLLERPHASWPLLRLMRLLYGPPAGGGALREALRLPLVPSWRALIERRLATGTIEDWSPRIDGPA
ncbi:MAG: MOSC domain-containing protein [Burkholderiaceae bacterium]|jgi:MOSC domain-containing protein YiiM|nr:MOSC domain-containing protein [Burkholderiaceae bacterium]